MCLPRGGSGRRRGPPRRPGRCVSGAACAFGPRRGGSPRRAPSSRNPRSPSSLAVRDQPCRLSGTPGVCQLRPPPRPRRGLSPVCAHRRGVARGALRCGPSSRTTSGAVRDPRMSPGGPERRGAPIGRVPRLFSTPACRGRAPQTRAATRPRGPAPSGAPTSGPSGADPLSRMAGGEVRPGGKLTPPRVEPGEAPRSRGARRRGPGASVGPVAGTPQEGRVGRPDLGGRTPRLKTNILDLLVSSLPPTAKGPPLFTS